MRQLALCELIDDIDPPENNKNASVKWYSNLYAPPAPVLDFSENSTAEFAISLESSNTHYNFDKFPVLNLILKLLEKLPVFEKNE